LKLELGCGHVANLSNGLRMKLCELLYG
jgi:hypothetical protein